MQNPIVLSARFSSFRPHNRLLCATALASTLLACRGSSSGGFASPAPATNDPGTSLANIRQLLTQAHARGIGVIMDHVINHSSNEHPLFKTAAFSPLNTQRDFYVWQATKSSGWSIYGKDPR